MRLLLRMSMSELRREVRDKIGEWNSRAARAIGRRIDADAGQVLSLKVGDETAH